MAHFAVENPDHDTEALHVKLDELLSRPHRDLDREQIALRDVLAALRRNNDEAQATVDQIVRERNAAASRFAQAYARGEAALAKYSTEVRKLRT